MNEITSQLSNREIALLIWLAVLFIFILAYRPTRQFLGPLSKVVFFSKVSVALLAMLAYVSFTALIFHWLGLAHWWMIKDALFWFFGTAVVLLFNTSQASKEDHFIRRIALDNLKFAVVLDFILNLHVFNLAVEIILLPFLAMLAMLAVAASIKAEYKTERKFINRIIAAIGLGLLIYALVTIVDDPRSFATAKNMEDFLTPIVLTLALLPFVYAAALFGAYGEMFVQVSFRIHDEKLLAYAKRQIVLACQFKLGKVNRFAKDFVHKLGGVKSRGEVLEVINAFRVSTSSEGRLE